MPKEEKCKETPETEKGKLCFDFINTVDWRNSNTRKKEMLGDFSALISWSKQMDILEDKTAQILFKNALKQPNKAKQVYEKAIELRELLYRIFSSIATTGQTSSHDLSIFNKYLADSMGKSCCLTPSDNGFVWSFCSGTDSMDLFLDPIIKSAADLLISSELKQVKQCANDACGWLFMDKSRNNSRRWCSMKDCGNQAKAHRHYLRKRQGKKNGGNL
jgi:predicted RNA-binding Zn ribbon-like protein